MTLRNDTARALVQEWATGRTPVWSLADVDVVTTRLVAISAAVTPLIVADEALADEDVQRFLLHRTRDAVLDELTFAAAGVAASLRLGPLVRAQDGTPALGLRGASIEELEGLRGVGWERARALARALALDEKVRSLADLDAAPGVGPTTLADVAAQAYLDTPRPMLVSSSLVRFASAPSVESYLELLESTDLELDFGDATSLARRPPLGGSALARFARLLTRVQAGAEARLSPLSGALASAARRALIRDDIVRSYRARLAPTNGTLVVDDDFLPAMLDLVSRATRSLRVAHFLATATVGADGTGGTLAIIQAIEARAAAGVSVRVLLDQDRPKDPYLSREINRPVVARLRAAGVEVRQDAPERLLHSKLLVTDENAVLVGSHNLSNISIARTHEVSVRLDSSVLARALATRFDALWEAAG